MPISVISLIDEDRQWHKSRQGFDIEETSRDNAFCGHAIEQDGVMVVEDTTRDPRFSTNSLVVGAPHIRFYAGVPLTVSPGQKIGTLCVVDYIPRKFSAEQQAILRDFSHLVISEMEHRVTEAGLGEELEAKRTLMQDLDAIMSNIDYGVLFMGNDLRARVVNDAFCSMWGLPREFADASPSFDEVLDFLRGTGIYDVPEEEWPAYREARCQAVREADGEAKLSNRSDGRILEYKCIPLADGGRMLTYTDVTERENRMLELRVARDRLEEVAYIDQLTGLANRASCQKDLAEQFSFTDAADAFAIIQIDLDNFKRVNDTLGHAAGDHLLRTLGKRLRLIGEEFPGFTPYRWGGDEFIAVVRQDHRATLEAICQEVTDLISISISYENATISPTVSLGVARFPEDADNLDDLMIFSDLALYKTKELGRDGYQFFTACMKKRLDEEADIEEELRVALADGQLDLFYQPQVSLAGGEITGIEALLRWHHPERGMIPPGKFLPVAAQVGLGHVIGRHVINKASDTASSLEAEGLEFGRLAINVSPEHLKRGTFLDDFRTALTARRITPRRFVVEILESYLFEDADKSILHILEQLRDAGVQVELDDFGTGYASLSHLTSLPVNGLKIDRSFVRDMMHDMKKQGVVKSMLSMSQLLKLRLVCEGIETREQLRLVSKMSSCSIQGFLIARPMHLDALKEWIAEERNLDILHLKEGLRAAS